MSVSVPQPFRTRVEGPMGPVTIAGIPDSYDLDVNSIPVIHVSVDNLPTIHVSIDNIPKIQYGVDPVEIRLTEFPSIRGHIPADFSLGLSVMGMELASLRLCGEAQVITEPYHPNPCEVCGPPQARPTPVQPLKPARPAAAGKRAPAKKKG